MQNDSRVNFYREEDEFSARQERESIRSSQYYGEINMRPSRGRKGVFAGRKSNGEYVVTSEGFSDEIIESKDDQGNSLYVTMWTKKEATNCLKCKKPIEYRDQIVTSTAPRSEFVNCMTCSGSTNGHVLHRRIITADNPIPTKNDSCIRCMRSLAKEMSVKWCIVDKAAYCPEGCDNNKVHIE